ncbi:hypothetical protein [Massilia cavernae]|uniref:hypothetical protein n=1 Tax=Massilia cavernae TaxID=2320864 RepID=UPI001603F02C|nr:hypothetical protein [Massilia cavernae]
MNILKHMEAVFLVSLAVAGPVTVAFDAIPEAHAAAARSTVVASAAPDQAIPVVVVSAKRMTDAEKLQSLEEEEARLRAVRMADRSTF